MITLSDIPHSIFIGKHCICMLGRDNERVEQSINHIEQYGKKVYRCDGGSILPPNIDSFDVLLIRFPKWGPIIGLAQSCRFAGQIILMCIPKNIDAVDDFVAACGGGTVNRFL